MAEHHVVRAPEGHKAYEAFFQAADDGDKDQLRAALLPSLVVNALQPDPLQGRSALHIASQHGNLDAIAFLLSQGAYVDLRDSEGETPLHTAALFAQTGAVRALLDAGADLSRPTGDYSMNALHNVLKYKHVVTRDMIDTITLLLDRGLDVNSPADHWGSTILGQACSLHDLDLVRLLVDRGASVKDVLSSAISDVALIKFLLEHGANISSAESDTTSALVDAAGGGSVEMLKLLLDHASVSDLAASAEALHWAAEVGKMENVGLLLEHGFDVNSFIENCAVGATPLLATCTVRRPSPENLAVAKFLIQGGADLYRRGTDGRNAEEIWLDSELAESYRSEVVAIRR